MRRSSPAPQKTWAWPELWRTWALRHGTASAKLPPRYVHRASRSHVQVSKNKVAPPYKLAEFDILFGSGISSQGCLLDAAEAVGIVSKKGSWYYYGEERLAQGRDKTLQELDERKKLAQ